MATTADNRTNEVRRYPNNVTWAIGAFIIIAFLAYFATKGHAADSSSAADASITSRTGSATVSGDSTNKIPATGPAANAGRVQDGAITGNNSNAGPDAAQAGTGSGRTTTDGMNTTSSHGAKAGRSTATEH